MMTALHWTVKRGYLELTAKLLSKGSDPDAVDIVGRTPLYLAIDNKENEIVKVVLNYIYSFYYIMGQVHGIQIYVNMMNFL